MHHSDGTVVDVSADETGMISLNTRHGVPLSDEMEAAIIAALPAQWLKRVKEFRSAIATAERLEADI